MTDLITTTKRDHEARVYDTVQSLVDCPLVQQLARSGCHVRPVAVTEVVARDVVTTVGYHAFVWDGAPFWSDQLGMIAKVQA